jgi:O-antigen/teichoic acid export membrane protein
VLSKKAVSAQIISNVVSAILKIVCIISDKGIFWLTLIYLVEASVYSGILLFSFRKFGNHLRKWKFNINIAKNLLSDSWPLMLSSVAIGIYMKIDQVMIKNMIGDEQAGIYAIAVKFSEVWYFIPAIICTSFFPSIINAKKINMTIYYKRLKRLFILMSSLAILISLSMFFISEFITDILLGNQYLQASSIIKIYIWSTVLVFGGTVISQYLVSKNYTKIFFYSNSIGAISNILLNLILIPKIGIVGASIATIISYSLSTIAIFIYKNTRIDLFNIIKIR